MTTTPVLLDLPFRGRWRVENSPASRVPSHGTHRLGTTYAIDFVAVDHRDRSAPTTVRSLFGAEPPERFVGFGVPILSPVTGIVVAVHDAEADHEARRSALTLIPYALGQAGRVRRGAAAVAGNHVIVAHGQSGPYVLLAHLQRGSVEVGVGDEVAVGHPLGRCGNSGNSTEPHVHVQATDSIDWNAARGLPIVFRRPGGEGSWLPDSGSIVEAGSAPDELPEK